MRKLQCESYLQIALTMKYEKVAVWVVPPGSYDDQGPRNLTIMAPITRNTYYVSRDLCSIMESAPRDRPTIMISYYGKKSLIT